MHTIISSVLLANLVLSISPVAKANTLFDGTGSATHDARSNACQQAERAARLDAARQAESFVHQVIRTTLVENQQGLQQSRSEFIEQTVYGFAQLQGTATEEVRLTQDQLIECHVQARYRIDSDAIRQHYLAEQARQARQAGQENTLANLHQELAHNRQAYQDLQQQLPVVQKSTHSITTFCEATIPLAQCEAMIGELIAQPYLQQLSSDLAIASHHLQPNITLQGSTELTPENSRLNQAKWQGSYQLRFKMSDPYAERNQQVHREIRQLQHVVFQPETHVSNPDMVPQPKQTIRFALTFGSDCMVVCSSSYMELASKPNAAMVRGNFLQANVHVRDWLSLNSGIYHENLSLCLDEVAGRGHCENVKSASVWYPALGFTVQHQWAYLEMMHLFSISETDLEATTLSKGYQRFELGLSTRQNRKGFTGAIGMSSRLMPASEASWDGWDIVLRVGYVF